MNERKYFRLHSSEKFSIVFLVVSFRPFLFHIIFFFFLYSISKIRHKQMAKMKKKNSWIKYKRSAHFIHSFIDSFGRSFAQASRSIEQQLCYRTCVYFSVLVQILMFRLRREYTKCISLLLQSYVWGSICIFFFLFFFFDVAPSFFVKHISHGCIMSDSKGGQCFSQYYNHHSLELMWALEAR